MNKRLRNLLFGSYLWFFGAGLLGPLYAIFAEQIGGDILDLTGAYALYLILAGMLSIYVGRISDHHSKKYLMISGYALNTIATFGYLLVDSSQRLFIVQGMFGVAMALAFPTWDSLFTMNLDKRYLGREWGLSEGGPYIVSGLAVLLGGQVLSHFGFMFLFIAMGTAQVLATIVQMRTLRRGN